MAVERNPVVALPQFADPAVPGSGVYTVNEILVYHHMKLERAIKERERVQDLVTFYGLVQLADGDDVAADVTAFNEGLRIAGRRIIRDYKAFANSAKPTPQTVRNNGLQDLLNNFSGIDSNSDGKITLQESGLHSRIFSDLDTNSDGFLTVAEISAGISQN